MLDLDLSNCSITCLDKVHGSGCDLVIDCKDRVLVIEVKKCTLSLEDADTIVAQIKECQDHIRKPSSKLVFRVFIHEKRGSCKVFGPALNVLKAHGIKYTSTATNSYARRLFNIYSGYCKK